ncbi:MAG: nucleolar RNA-binding Nop10p family protein [Nanoarchaeota archaeon]
MVEHIHKCPQCSRYTLEETCPVCKVATLIPRPPKFSSEDKYAKMKREMKKPEFAKKGLY